MEIINAALPASTVTTEIKSGKLTYQDNDLVKPTFVPIYREYDTVDVISPITAQKQAKGPAVVSKSGTVPEETYAGFDYTGIKLNLGLAKRDLQAAEDLIKQKDTKAATATLQDILVTGVIFEYSTMDQPLVRAMDNLRLAESELKANHPDAAKIALIGRIDALKNYEKLTNDTRSKEVRGAAQRNRRCGQGHHQGKTGDLLSQDFRLVESNPQLAPFPFMTLHRPRGGRNRVPPRAPKVTKVSLFWRYRP